jgi:hypothetical protein
MPLPEPPERDPLIRKVVAWILVLVVGIWVCVFLAYTAGVLPWDYGPSNLRATVNQHFAAIVGLPSAALAALSLVFILESRSGKIEFEVFGLKLRGASGPIVLWVVAFLAITVAIKGLW